MAPSSATKPKEEENNVSYIDRIAALKDDELFMIFELLPRSTLTKVALVCKRWNRISVPQINLMVEFTFSISSQRRNHDLLQHLRNKNSTVTQQVRIIKIEDWLPPSGVEIEREEDFYVGDETSDQALEPQAQLQQLIWLIPRLPISKLIWAAKLTIPTTLLRTVSQQPSLDFEILSQEFGKPLLPEICRLPRRRLKLIEAMSELKITNITKLEFCVPILGENTRLVRLLGNLIRASSRLRILTLVAILPMVPRKNREVLMCPWATRGAKILPFPAIEELRLEKFKLDIESTQDRDSWRRLIQWSEIVTFTTDCNLFFSEHNMPKLKRLKLLDSFESPEHALQQFEEHRKAIVAFRVRQEASREYLLGCPTLTHLEIADEALLDKGVWDRHKTTLSYLKVPATDKLRITTFQGQIIRELPNLRSLTRLAVEIIPPLLPGTLFRNGPSSTTAIWHDIMDLTPGLVWVQHLELDLHFVTDRIGLRYCKELWADLWQTILKHGTTVIGPDYCPRLRKLDLKYRDWGSRRGNRRAGHFKVGFLSESLSTMGHANPSVISMESEHLRRWGKEHQESPGCLGYQSAVRECNKVTSAQLGTPNLLETLFKDEGGDDVSDSELPGLVGI